MELYLFNETTGEMRMSFTPTRYFSAAHFAADFLFDCTIDEKVNIDEYGLYELRACASLYDGETWRYNAPATETMRKIFREYVEKERSEGNGDN